MRTRFTDMFDLKTPIASAPMAGAAGGRLAAAVSAAGGLGFVGGGYGDADWLEWELEEAAKAAPEGPGVGVGFITWSLQKKPALLDMALAHRPRAVFLSFGDLRPFAPRIAAAGVPLIAQVQDMEQARAAVDDGAEVIVAQGAEAGGHGAIRGGMTLVPEIADLLAARAPDTVLLAAGGIADGRGLAAALCLGADGALVGSRFWAAAEALVPQGFHDAALDADGDATLRTRAVDRARGLRWPGGYTIRVMRSTFTDRWHDDPEGLEKALPREAPLWQAAFAAGDAAIANPIVGEAVGLIHRVRPAADIIEDMTTGARAALSRAADAAGAGR
ncbi:nitronate monooxygenase [Rhodovulum sp. DZ06]|uniref:nitronate monooxygenase n=1 Tax=Rhodovulum sp. DZ06 TaxID=3425126 RepID=UPI003D351A52